MVWIIWSSFLMFKCLGNLFENLEKPFAKLFFDMPKSYQSHMMIPPENLIHIWCLSCIKLCQIVVTLGRILFMLSWSRFTCTPYTPLLCFFEKLALYHPSIPQNKSSIVCVGLSLSPVIVKTKKERKHGLLKKMWTHEGPSVEKKEKNVGTWRSMKKKRDSRTLKRIYI